MKKIKVFFDGRCNVCSKEISFYKKIDKKKNFEWLDINVNQKTLKKYKISFNESLLFLHVINEKDKIIVGVDAFVVIWRQFKYWKILAFIVDKKPLNNVLKYLYTKWANKRYSKISYRCDI